jgi:hypothetical protein
MWSGGNNGELDCLASCYRNSLEQAKKLGCGSIAFPLISTGVYGFPKDKALKIAVDTISAFLDENEMDVTLVVFDKASFRLSAELSEDVDKYLRSNFEVREYIDDSYVRRAQKENYGPSGNLPLSRRQIHELQGISGAQLEPGIDSETPCESCSKTEKIRRQDKADGSRPASGQAAPEADILFSVSQQEPGIDDFIGTLGESFSDCLLRMIDERGLTDAQVYKKANIDRKLFSKIRCLPDYKPKKKTALAFAVSLELNLDETLDLLKKAGFTLSHSSKFDLIVEYCITHGIYNVNDINTILFDHDQELLAG